MTDHSSSHPKILINGRTDSGISPADRGLAYGDGLFETIACINGQFLLWDRHMHRLRLGCERLYMPMFAEEVLLKEAEQLRAGNSSGVLKILVTRGSGGRGYRSPQDTNPLRIVSWHDHPDYSPILRNEGVRVRFCTTPISIQPHLAGLKHCNRLDQVLARSEWQDDTIQEGLMFDGEGRLISGTMSNVFLVKDAVIYTPDLRNAGVAGCMRTEVISAAAALDLSVKITDISRADLQVADELFLTNSVFGVWPIQELDGQVRQVGPITKRLQNNGAELWCPSTEQT